jgi:ATP-binding cassette subfamily B protein
MRGAFQGFGPYAAAHRWQWITGFLVVITSTMLRLVGPPVILARAIDELRAAIITPERLMQYALLIVGASALANILWVFARRTVIVASRQISYEIRQAIFNKLTTLDQHYFFRTRTGDLMNRLTGDLNAVQETFGFGLLQGTGTMLTLIISLILMFSLSVPLGLIVLVVFPVVALILTVMSRTIAKRYVAVQEQASLISAKAQENFSGVRVVKGYAIEDREIKEYGQMNLEYRRRVLSLARVEGPMWATVGLLMNLVFVGVLLVGARTLIGGSGTFAGLSLGQFVQFTTYLFELSWPMLAVGMMVNIAQRGASSWRRLSEILETEAEIKNDGHTDYTIKSLSGAIQFDHVSLKSGGRTLLQDVTLEVPRGMTLGITGRTGAGKTLLASLVGRLLDPSSGRVLVDETDVKRIPLEVLRGSIGYVPQEPFLFSDTIAENIAFGLPERVRTDADAPIPMDTVQWAAKVAGLSKDVEDFPARYETMLGERGVTLSGGQRQRTALARAVARKPSILILDDSMSAVDTETEARILTELKTVLEGRTVLLIGHRVSTLRHAEHIIVLENGRIAEQGSHDALLSLGGIYAEMDRKQGLASALETEEDANDEGNEAVTSTPQELEVER